MRAPAPWLTPILFVPLLALVPATAPAQTAAFIVRLGTDTTAVERFTRTATRIEGDAVVRSPRTVIRHFVIEFGPGGAVTRAEVELRAPGAAPGAAPIQRTVAVFSRDTVAVEIRRDTSVTTRKVAVRPGVVPVLAGAASSWVGLELLAVRARQGRGDSTGVPVYAIGAQAAGTWSVKTLGRDSVWLYDNNNTFHARVDREGRIAGAVPLSGTQQFTVERVATADIPALAARFAAREQQGQALGVLSTRDTVNATVGGATLWIDYGRPAKRGRVIFGSAVVPWGEVWRTGANAATQFRTDRALEMGGVVVPAGFYTLWTIPSQSGWKLLINSQTGQWGTAHDPARDLFQLDLRTSTLPQSVERFIIRVSPEGQGGVLHLEWDTTRASIPFTVR